MKGSLVGCHNRVIRPEAAVLIAVDPEMLHGQAHIRETRIGVSAILDAMAPA